MGMYRMIEILPKSELPLEEHYTLTDALVRKELTWKWEGTKRVLFEENPTCSICGPLHYREEEKYEFKDISSFDVAERGRWGQHHCIKCDAIFNFPIKLGTCIKCGCEEIEVQGKGIGKLYISASTRASTWAPNLEHIRAAREDMANNPAPGNEGFDWGGLKQTMDNTDYTGMKVDTSSNDLD